MIEKVFDELYFYIFGCEIMLCDCEMKQIEMMCVEGVKVKCFYVYDGVVINSNNYCGWNLEVICQDCNYGIVLNNKIWVMCEFENMEVNGFGLLLFKGCMCFYC